jgi:hypothetical protein
LDGRAYLWLFVDGEIVEDDDIARPQLKVVSQPDGARRLRPSPTDCWFDLTAAPAS